MSSKIDISSLLKPIQTDIDMFLQRFSKEKSPHCKSFETFRTLWHDIHFHLIYSCQTAEELFIFQDLLLDTVKKRLLPPYPSLWQLGAVYLLFAFLELAPYKRHLSIIRLRLTLEDLRGVQKLLRYLRVEEEHEATSMLMYMLQNHCQIVAHPMSELRMHLVKHGSSRLFPPPDSVDTSATTSSHLSNMTLQSYLTEQLESFGFLNKMVATNKQYCALKSLVPDVKESSLCTLIGADLVTNICGGSDSIDRKEKGVSTPSRGSTEEAVDIGMKRSLLKFKSFSMASTNSRGGVGLQGPEPTPEEKKKKKKPYQGKPYVTSRGAKMPILEDDSTVQKLQKYRSEKPGKKRTREAVLERMARRILPEEKPT